VTAKTAASVEASVAAPERAADFIGALGVNIHLGQPGYGPATIVSDMAYLGLSNVRSHAIGSKTPATQATVYGQLAAFGLKFDWLTGGALPATLADLDAFLSAHPGSIPMIEGPNEVNNFPITFNGLAGNAAAVAYQTSLYQALKADPLTASVPVLDFTGPAGLVGPSDGANGHPYPKAGAQPLATLVYAVNQLGKSLPGKPIYFTEAGYFSLPGQHGWEGVDEATQAKLTLNLVMDAAKLGVAGLYLYDLVDDGADPNGKTGADHFGLFTLAGRAKPVAVAIHNLTSILADGGAAASDFTPTALNYSITGLPSSGDSLVIEKSSGVYDLVIWAEPDIWNQTTHTPIAAATQSVTVSFASPFAQASVFDPMVSDSALQSVSNASAVTVALSDHPIVVQVSGFAQAMATFSASTSVGGGAVSLTSPSSPSVVLAPPSH
jgi:hypothetical protein